MQHPKVVVIVGANGGLGRHVTQACLEAGYRVAGVAPGITVDGFAGADFAPLPSTIANSKDAAEMVTSTLARWGRVDALVHLAGGFEGGRAFAATDEAAFERLWQTNVMSFVHAAHAVLPLLQEQRSGTLIAIGSRAVLRPQLGLGAYAATKSALVSLIRTIAIETRDHGVTANAILPGTMDTPGNRAAMPDADPARWVHPSQVAAMIVHLLSDRAAQVSGAVIPILGGEL